MKIGIFREALTTRRTIKDIERREAIRTVTYFRHKVAGHNPMSYRKSFDDKH
jgi:hypothetical protein